MLHFSLDVFRRVPPGGSLCAKLGVACGVVNKRGEFSPPLPWGVVSNRSVSKTLYNML